MPLRRIQHPPAGNSFFRLLNESGYTEDHPEVSPLLARTKMASRIAGGAGKPAALPAKVDLRPSFSPIEDQGALGSCTAQAAAGLLEYFERRSSGVWVDAS